jgi:ribonuclease Z
MTLHCQILGEPGRDNALLVRVESGQATARLLFDCGEGCVSALKLSEILSIDHLFFSHLHMDHVAGFDSLFRGLYNRVSKPNMIWGPPQTAAIMSHRFQGFLWNLVEGQPGEWRVADVFEDRVETSRFELSEAFALRHDAGTVSREGPLLFSAETFAVECLTMDHATPSLAYIVREKPKRNIDLAKLGALGLRPGPWLQEVKADAGAADRLVRVGDQEFKLGQLREALVVETPGDAIAYLTDFLLDEAATERLEPALRGVRVLVCEAQYRQADDDLAVRNRHMTTARTGELARRSGAQELILFHLSSRYDASQWGEMLDEARAIFPAARFPEGWRVGDLSAVSSPERAATS